MHPTLFNIGAFSFYSFGLMVALGFFCIILLSLFYAKKEGIKTEFILDLAVYATIGSFIGARIFYVVGQWNIYRDNLFEIFMLQNGGLVFLGGLIFGLVVIMLYAKIKQIPILKLLDAISPGVVLGYAIGRIGCFLNGCCFGVPTHLTWGITFPQGSLASFFLPEVPLHPTQLYSFFSMLLAFIILLLLYRNKKYDGQIFFWALIFYSVYRFTVEYFRFSPIHTWGLTPSQLIVIVTFFMGLLGVIFKSRLRSS
jgi:phosphatidylglycerol:prolipoprotein diacylglycerol transferase